MLLYLYKEILIQARVDKQGDYVTRGSSGMCHLTLRRGGICQSGERRMSGTISLWYNSIKYHYLIVTTNSKFTTYVQGGYYLLKNWHNFQGEGWDLGTCVYIVSSLKNSPSRRKVNVES